MQYPDVCTVATSAAVVVGSETPVHYYSALLLFAADNAWVVTATSGRGREL